MTDLRLNYPARADDPDLPDVPVPPGPEPREPGENKALTSPINELESRLLRQRKVLVFGAIDDKVARDVTGACSRSRPTGSRLRSTSTRRAATSRAAIRSTT
jgi:hypothetical protein